MTTVNPYLKYFVQVSFFLNFLFGLSNLNAQIIYTDIDPDFVSENLGDYYYLDLNNDEVVDFSLISINYEILDYLEINSIENNVNGIISVTPWYAHPEPLDYGMEIFNLAGYTNGESYEPNGFFAIGFCFGGGECFYDWENKTNKFLGLRFLIDNNTHYGWARLDVTSPTQWVIKDYAYESSPDTGILAGEPIFGLNQSNTLNNIIVVTSNKKISIYNVEETTQYSLISMTGQCLLKGSISKENTTIDTTLILSGFYVIEFKNAQTGQTIRKKLIL